MVTKIPLIYQVSITHRNDGIEFEDHFISNEDLKLLKKGVIPVHEVQD